jgi:hypothetical protein
MVLRLVLPPQRFIVLLTLSYVMHVLLLNDNDGDEGLDVAFSTRTGARAIEVSFLSC